MLTLVGFRILQTKKNFETVKIIQAETLTVSAFFVSFLFEIIIWNSHNDQQFYYQQSRSKNPQNTP